MHELIKSRQLKSFVQKTITYMIIFITLIMTVVITLQRSVQFHRNSLTARTQFLEKEKEKIRIRVESALSLVKNEIAQEDSSLRFMLKQRVDNAYSLAHSLNETYQYLPREAREKLIIEAIRSLRFNEGRGYFFITRHDGVEMLFTDKPQLEGKNLLSLLSGEGKPVIPDMIRISKSKKHEGFYEYQWTRPGFNGMNHKKLSFVKNFEPFDWLIGIGEYLQEYDKAQQGKIIQILNSMKDHSGNYLFAGQWNGLSLMGPTVGKNQWNAKDLDGVMVVQKLVATSIKGGGFVEYRMPQGTGYPPTRKLSYVLPVSEWNWYIGSGVSIDSIEEELAFIKKSFIKDQIYTLFISIIFLIISLYLVKLILPYFYKKVNNDLEILTAYLNASIHKTQDSVSDKLWFNEFFKIAESTEIMVAQRQNIQDQMHQNQKMEAIGLLAGGIAHDFNNVLSAIIGAAEMLKVNTLTEIKRNEFTDIIITASKRAGDMTKKLLTFSRKGIKISSSIDCLKVINDTIVLLEHTLNKNITISLELNATHSTIIGDDNLLQNALVNMGINASHAMPNGGKLVFSLENIYLDEDYCRLSPFDINAGDYLEISISDTGVGIPQKLMNKIFEPFFTTKVQGQGTGLGLSMVYGMIMEHNGAITVYSEEGIGTVFHLYIPIVDEIVDNKSDIEEIIHGSGTILIVDDEEIIRITASSILESLGYHLFNAQNGEEALQVFIENQQNIDLIILDMIMPVMGGRETLKQLRNLNTNVPVIISSGFTKDEDMKELKKLNISGFLHKPFRKAELAKMVAKSLKSEDQTLT